MPNEPRQNFGTRLPRALIDAIEARANTTGRTKTQIFEDALVAYLGLEEATEGTDVMQRLADVEQRLTAVERRLTKNAQQRPTNVMHRPTVAQQPPNDARTEGDSNAELSDPPPPPKREPTPAPAKGESVYTWKALILAGAPITEAQASGGNRDKAMLKATGLKSGPWLEAQGWVPTSQNKTRWWPPPD
jgi:hypothetical protein